MSEQWISVKEAAKRKNCTTANIRYYITAGKVEAKKDGGRWLINPETLESEKDFSQPFDVLSTLKAQLEEKDKQIALLQEELKGQAERSDTIILQLTRQNQPMLEDKRKKSRWKTFFGKARSHPEEVGGG